MSDLDLHGIRENYSQRQLIESDCQENPLDQFSLWLKEALRAKVNEPTAMNIATVDDRGYPHARIILLKEINEQGFVFFTNYRSAKANHLESHAFAALTFFWPELERQVRIEGVVGKIPPSESDAYFATRPYASQIGAWASQQSSVVPNDKQLLTQFNVMSEKYTDLVPRPEHWGGYVLVPHLLEFWQGRPNRLHDRIRYQQKNGAWELDRLSP